MIKLIQVVEYLREDSRGIYERIPPEAIDKVVL